MDAGAPTGGLHLAVAVSGGIDSTALLHACARLATPLGVQVHALHVHHGLQPEADSWLAGVAAQCRRWARRGLAIEFHEQRLRGGPARGESIEAWARRERYRALAAMAHAAGCSVVLLAQHRRDQAETVLLQALRGAGSAGLAAMPARRERDGIVWLRPWLEQPRAAIEAYARRWRLRAVLDPSNADPRFARSRLRTQVWPALQAAFPEAEVALAAVARRAALARALEHEVATQDLRALCDGDALRIPAWLALSPARRAAALHAWLARALAPGWPMSLLHRLLQELPGATQARWPAGDAELRVYRGRLIAVRPSANASASTHTIVAPSDRMRSIDLSQPGDYEVPPWVGRWRVEHVHEGGVPAARLRDCELRPRRGGEQFQRHPQGPPRRLKKQFQELGVPPWERNAPLLWAQGQLVFVPGLGLDARAQALPGEPRVRLHWLP